MNLWNRKQNCWCDCSRTIYSWSILSIQQRSLFNTITHSKRSTEHIC